MDEKDIKELRHSFTNPFRDDLPKPKVNQFGHTILSDKESDIDLSNYNLEMDESGQVVANLNQSLFDSPQMSNWIKSRQNEPEIEAVDPEPSKPQIISNKVDIATLISELNEMDGYSQKLKPSSDGMIQIDENTKIGWSGENFKSCLNKDCMCNLPKDAKFCMKCGTAQMSKFCTECGYNFPGMEKFCPDCGNKR